MWGMRSTLARDVSGKGKARATETRRDATDTARCVLMGGTYICTRQASRLSVLRGRIPVLHQGGSLDARSFLRGHGGYYWQVCWLGMATRGCSRKTPPRGP